MIVCMNRLDNLYPCLESIRRHAALPCETFVVAYRFSEENLSSAMADFPEVEFIRSDEVRGFSENNNLALRRARGRFCLVLNDDAELRPGVLETLAADFDRLPPDAAIVCPRLVNADGSLQLCGRPPYPAMHYVLQQWHLWREPIDDTLGKEPVFGSVFRTSNISGAAFLIRTDVFRGLGWFDERYFFTPEDIALSTLARDRGYGVYVDRSVEVMHKWRTTASAMSVAVRPAAVRGSLIFFSRGSSLRYFCMALSVWLAEAAKFVKASLRCLVHPTGDNRVKRETFRSVCACVFSRRSPKDLFVANLPRV